MGKHCCEVSHSSRPISQRVNCEEPLVIASARAITAAAAAAWGIAQRWGEYEKLAGRIEESALATVGVSRVHCDHCTHGAAQPRCEERRLAMPDYNLKNIK